MQHYVYKITNKTTGEYYYGKRSCEGSWRDDSYMGSGTLLKAKMKAHPDHDWCKEVLLLLDTEEEAYTYEAISIGDRWRDDPLCLNLKEGGEGVSSASWTPELRERQANTTREALTPERREAHSAAIKANYALGDQGSYGQAYRDKQAKIMKDKLTCPIFLDKLHHGIKARYAAELVEMCKGDETICVPRSEITERARAGWSPAKGARHYVNHPTHEVTTRTRASSFKQLIDAGWEYGKVIGYTVISLKEAKALT